MATNLDAMPYLGGASATPSQLARVKEIPLSAPWAQPPDRPFGIADRCRAAMFGVYLRYKNIPEETARHIFRKHEGGCAAAWLRVDAHECRMSEAARLARPGLRDRCLAAMFGLYLRCKGITEETAREIFAGHVGSRRACVLAWFKVHGRLNDLKEAHREELIPHWSDWVSRAPDDAEPAATRDVAGSQATLPQAAATSQVLDHAGGTEQSAIQAPKDVRHEELVAQWRERFAQACAGAAWDDREVRALMDLRPAEEQRKLREEITARAQKAGPRAGAPLERDPERLAIQIVAGEIAIRPAFGSISAKPNIADGVLASAPMKGSMGGASGLAALGGMEASPWPQRQSDAVHSGRGHEPEEVSASNSPGRLRTETAAESLDRSWRRLKQGLDSL